MSVRQHFDPMLEALNQVILGKETITQEILLSFLCGGHVLLKDQPGVGKTTLALAFSKLLGLDFKRVQFTPDIMPSDLTGFSVLDRTRNQFVYQQGLVFCNILLVDEINRTSPKTQSALLEVMEEGCVSVDGITRQVPRPFFVIATQNPEYAIGTQALPEAQIDRFMIECSLGYPSKENELRLIRSQSSKTKIEQLSSMVYPRWIEQARKEIQEIYVSDVLYDYIVTLVRFTRKDPYLQTGASPRATLALVALAKAEAWFSQRDYVIPQDVQKQFPFVMNHRIMLSARARQENLNKNTLIDQILQEVKVPR